MREGGGDFQPHVDGCFLEAIPNERLVFTTVLTEGWQPVDPWLALTAILTFEAKDGGTLYSARVLHKNPEDSAKHKEMGFHEGWGMAIGQLAVLVER
ncbi:SRPBCC domain-containing protein [Sphingopyxis sp. PAMC25046]|uniref:SRPBCC domain-containing protein n=1 Tax=Sphingopyxis sp. PAMC25046 TaxID=2565556 RepID=UPI002491775A|nr:SRPBCC domain-containing protein [Sphingopyxis sp. PAMC25046]